MVIFLILNFGILVEILWDLKIKLTNIDKIGLEHL